MIILVCGALVGCSVTQEVSDDAFYGIKTADVGNVVFVIDVSGSMKERYIPPSQALVEQFIRPGSPLDLLITGGRERVSKLASAKRHLAAAVSGLPAGSNFSIVAFSGQTHKWRDTLSESTAENKRLAIEYVQKLGLSSNTYMLPALKAAFSFRRMNTVFFLSDGQPSDATPRDVIKVAAQLNEGRRARFYTIGIGRKQNWRLLQTIARQNSGRYVTG